MANYKVNLSLRVVDGNSTTATCLAYLYDADTVTIAGLVTALGTFAAAVDGAIDGVITDNRILITPPLVGGLKTTGTATATFNLSRVEQIGLFDFKNAASPAQWGFAVPSFSNSLISSGKIITATTAVTTLTDLVGATPYSNNVSQINTGFTRALLATRKKRKQLQRSSAEIE